MITWIRILKDISASLQENDSVEYAAVHFKNKRPKTAGRQAEYSTAVFTDTT